MLLVLEGNSGHIITAESTFKDVDQQKGFNEYWKGHWVDCEGNIVKNENIVERQYSHLP